MGACQGGECMFQDLEVRKGAATLRPALECQNMVVPQSPRLYCLKPAPQQWSADCLGPCM